MKEKYEAPQLFVDEYVADTMIASNGGDYDYGSVNPKNGNAANNQNCWGCDQVKGQSNGYGEDICIYYPGDKGTYNAYC